MSAKTEIVKALEKSSGFIFNDKQLALQALTHTSYAYHNEMHRSESNERLEYLGDALLRTYVARHLFLQFPQEDEGALSRMSARALSGKALAKAARLMGLNLIMLFSRQEEATGGRQKDRNLAGCFEALTAAIYLDSGDAALYEFLEGHLKVQISSELSDSTRDPKSALQEKIQANGKELPVYKVIERSGPAHSPMFTVSVSDGDRVIAEGNGRSIKEAEQAAAEAALKSEGKTGVLPE